MVFVACGFNHKSASLNFREKVALTAENQDLLLYKLINSNAANEAVVMSTCNRTEIYCESSSIEHLSHVVADFHQLPEQSIKPHFYVHTGNQGIRHILRVASGLDSMMIGEPQIFGQIKRSYEFAYQLGSVKENLQKIFPFVFKASKRIRTHSGIGNNPVSIAFAAVQLIEKAFKNFEPLTVLIIGSGETSSLVAKYLHKNGASKFIIASRTEDNAKNLAHNFNGVAVSIMDLHQHLVKADVVISATACPFPFINQSLINDVLKQRNQAPLFLLDLAVPRDIEANVAEIENVSLFNIDDLESIVEKGRSERQEAALKAEQLVEIELEEYIRWHRSLRANQVICDYRSQMKELTQAELQRALQKLASGQCQEIVLNEFANRLLNKLTHSPTVGLKEAAQDNRIELLDFAKYILQGNNSIYEEVT
ncbi:glutamyl tRNA reductase (plasmid) [Legionella adelaidensis]|uniref:Glutamyl-tRNA reductase n=1 Tax=Legionella adelaidensis TaxID=45056 RepID=A0A0W0R2U3_9GAMM|nr:glutamyl-tRNA reductase [Legionella adelaidensis]KTC65398.1 glutamyl tRNA reductase [Legionella adelaidensis]VEH84780.1 glutamyl tRNA reductase [Legionella adelaidensis]